MNYFHVNSSYPPESKQLLRVGDTISTFNLPCNPFYEEVTRNIHHAISYGGPPRRLIEWFRSPEAKAIPRESLHRDVHVILQASVRLIREMEFENVRRAEFSNLPSRTRAIWFSDSLEGAKYWQHRVAKTGPTQIVSVEVDGVIHRADGRHLPYDAASISELRDAARRYWKGEAHLDQEPEYLFEGCMTVVGVVG